tara:strand:+ start:351 stop:539 length:189 start_codon:yes stop_codon:yes gene_type:complete
MEYWQSVFLKITIYGFFFQILLIIGAFQITKNLPPKKSNKDILEHLYKLNDLSIDNIKNLKL